MLVLLAMICALGHAAPPGADVLPPSGGRVSPPAAATPAAATPAAAPEESAPEESAAGEDLARGYHRREEVDAAGAALAARWPGRVRVERVGNTAQGRPILGYRVRDPGAPVGRKLLVFANIHALEWISTEVALALLEDVARRPPPGVEVLVIPMLNVDGRLQVEADLGAGRTRAYRRANAQGVDLNRDFAVNRDAPAIWRHLIPGYYAVPPQPLSEPEARAIDRLAAQGWDAAVSLHAFGGYAFLPWAGRWQRAPDWPALHALGLALQRGQGAGAYKTMQLSRWAFFFRGQGMEIDHLYGRYGIPSVLMELTRSGIERPADLHIPFRWYNPRRPARHVALGTGALHALAWDMSWALGTGQPEPWHGLSVPPADAP